MAVVFAAALGSWPFYSSAGQPATEIEAIDFSLSPMRPAREDPPRTNEATASGSDTIQPIVEASVPPAHDEPAAKGGEASEEARKSPIQFIAPASEVAAAINQWVVSTGDNHGQPFIIIDKIAAEVLVYKSDGQQVGATPALVGIAPGDDATPGVGDRELAEIGPAERTTPAGRFVARIGPAKGNQKVLWVDYATSVALHPVVTGNKKERRQERLDSPSPSDNRITFGCINVPARFFDEVVSPLFVERGGIVYVLPDTKFLIEVFPTFQAQQAGASLAAGSY